jgi:hypothetical protein
MPLFRETLFVEVQFDVGKTVRNLRDARGRFTGKWPGRRADRDAVHGAS